MKKGTSTVGVQRQYTSTAGRIETARVAVHMVYAGQRGHVAVDRGLCIPRSWTSDPDRCCAAGLRDETRFATKSELAARMVTRFLDAGHRAPGLRATRSTVATRSCEPCWRCAPSATCSRWPAHTRHHRCQEVPCGQPRQEGAKAVLAEAARRGRGKGAKGHRFYDWAVIDLTDAGPGSRQLLIRRNRSTGELAYYRCYSPEPVPLTTLVRVAGSRWRVEEFFQSGKRLAALDEHQVRRYASWPRWVTLAVLAHAFLAVVRADEHARSPTPDGLIQLTCNEIQRLFITLVVRPAPDIAHRLSWSDWRRCQDQPLPAPYPFRHEGQDLRQRRGGVGSDDCCS
ncbi:IS701 family transposase [Streptomyces canus]|nr:IS701 family transposase [Streptomyces canus]